MDYQPNSHRYKAEQEKSTDERKKVEKVVTGVATTKKKSGLDKLFHLFLTEGLPAIKTYVLDDIFIPAGKKALMGTLDIILNGKNSGGYDQNWSSAPKTQYRKYSDVPSGKSSGVVTARTHFEYEDVKFPDRGDAELVLRKMKDIYSEFGVVTIAEMYEASGLSYPYTFNRYGWQTLRGAEVVRRGDGYFITLPPAELVTNR